MSTLPPGSNAFPPSVPGKMRRNFYVAERSGVSWIRRGPFLATRVPTTGGLQVVQGDGGQLVEIEERIFLPLVSAVRTRSILTDVQSGLSFEVIQVKIWSNFIEAFVRRQAADS